MEEGEKTKNNQSGKIDNPKEVRPHSKEAKGDRDSNEEEDLIEKQVDGKSKIEASQHFVQFQPSAPPQPTMAQVLTHCEST